MELISCHDCDLPVSFTAAGCPHCGSREPSGPYRHSRKEARRIGIEGRNDTRLILMTAGMAVTGAFYGIKTSSLWAVIAAPFYGFIGACIGTLLAFAMNVTRNWW
jgi:hypothetical protein